MAKKNSNATRLDDLAGAPPQLATVQDFVAANPPLTGRTHAKQRASKIPGRINLKAVADALAEEGLDPTTEMIRVLKAKIPVTDRQGNPVIDLVTGEQRMIDMIDPDTKLRTLNELLQYTQPKLKSVEMKVSGSFELTDEQLDARIAGLMAKAGGKRR